MGMYTELSIGVRIKGETPSGVIAALEAMASPIVPNENTTDEKVRKKSSIPPETLAHPLFDTERWAWMLRSGGGYYFRAQPTLVWGYDKVGEGWNLTFCTNIKNYSNEWEHFLDFIAPWIEGGEDREYIGTYRYEEDEYPSLVFINAGKVEMFNVT